MATQVPYRLFKTNINGMPSVQALATPNTPWSYSEIDYAGLGSAAKELGDYYRGNVERWRGQGGFNFDNAQREYNERFGGDAVYNQIAAGQYDPATLARLFNMDSQVVSGFAPGGALPTSGYVIDNQGRFMQQASLDQENYWKAEEAAGRARNIGSATAPMYVPVGSAADLNAQGKTFEQQLATPSVQQQIQNQNLTPVNPNSPAPQVAGANTNGFTGFMKTPNDATVYGVRADGSYIPLNYDQYLAAGGPKDFSTTKVVNQLPAQPGAVQTTPLVNVSASGISTQTSSTNLGQTPITGLDIQSLLQQNQLLQQQILAATQPSARESEIQKQLGALNTGLLQGTVNIKGQRIPQPLIGKQAQALQEQIAFQQTPLIQELEVLSGNRQNILKALSMAQQFGSDNIQLQLQLQQAAKQEQQAAKDFSLKSGITTPYYVLNGTVYNSTTGKPFVSEADFKKQTGMDVGTAAGKGMIQEVNQNFLQEKAIVADLAQSYPDAAIALTDSLAVAQAKVRTSRIYQDKIRGPESDTKRLIRTTAVDKAMPAIQASTGQDGYADPGVYLKLRTDWVAAGVGSASEFDSTFSPYLSSTERQRLLKTYKSDSSSDISPEVQALLGL